MSTALFDSIPATTPERKTHRRIVFPVGARYQRHTVELELAFLSSTATAPIPRVLVFPVGARFPRRSESDAAEYQTEMASRGTTSTRMAYPVGARFPRRRG